MQAGHLRYQGMACCSGPLPFCQDNALMHDPILVEITRGPLTESSHRGAAAVVAADGRVIAAWGDVDRPVFPRSAIKFIQALPLIESGAADVFNLSPSELAIACASHSAEPRHLDVVRHWLERLGLTEADLHCGAHAPRDEAVAEAVFRAGLQPTRAYNNCSGKHTGFLTLALHLGVATQGYAKPPHPVQDKVLSALSELSGVEIEHMATANDGCGAANYALPLQALARAFARLSDPRQLPADRAQAIGRLQSAIKADPFMVAGTDRSCTTLIQAASGGAWVKIGAEGVYVACLPAQRLGIAVKIADGAARAASVAIAALMHRFGALPDRSLMVQPIINTRSEITGHLRPAAGWL
jgi:L-asparaginase II